MTAPLPAELRLCLRRRRVPSSTGSVVAVSLRVPSDVGCIEEVIDLLMRHLCTDSWLCRRLRFNLRVALAEALANAIIAGNQEDRSKWVEVQAELGGDLLKVEVTDQGPASIPPDRRSADARGARPGQRTRPLPDPEAGGRRPVQCLGELHLHDTSAPLTGLESVADALGALVGARVRLWRYDGRGLRAFGAGIDPGFSPPFLSRPAWYRPRPGRPGSPRCPMPRASGSRSAPSPSPAPPNCRPSCWVFSLPSSPPSGKRRRSPTS